MTSSETLKQLQQRLDEPSLAAAFDDALRALEQEAQLLEELGELRTLVRNPTKWMAWCDSQILERAEQAEAEATRLRADLELYKRYYGTVPKP